MVSKTLIAAGSLDVFLIQRYFLKIILAFLMAIRG
jgi:hypothetical protein